MRVVLANKFLWPKGGAERAVLDVGAELQRRGHRVHYFGMAHPQNAVSGPDVEVVRERDYRRSGAAAWRDAAAMAWSFEAGRRFSALLRRARPDIVHCHNIYHQLTPSILDAAAAAGVPTVLTAHDYKLACPRYDMLRHGRPCDACVEDGPLACARYRCVDGSWLRSLWLAAESALHRARRSYDRLAAIVVPSHFVANVLLRLGTAPERLRWVPNFAPSLAPAPAPDRPDRFVYVGRLSPEKGVETLVAAAARLPRGQLVICGDGPLRSRIEHAARAAPAGRIELRGHQDATGVAKALGEAAFAVAPSEWFENAPFAVLEAMGAGRGVVASRIGGLPELVTDGETGALVPPGDIEGWTAALLRAIAAPETTRAWGRAGRARAERDYALGVHVDRLEALYQDIVS